MSLLYNQVEQRRALLDATAENATRRADVTVSFESSGYGEVALPQSVSFGITFLYRPEVATGVSLASGSLVNGKFPNVSAGVYRWERLSNGFYVGAYLYFVVDSNMQGYNLIHDITFATDAIKLYSPALLG